MESQSSPLLWTNQHFTFDKVADKIQCQTKIFAFGSVIKCRIQFLWGSKTVMLTV